MSTPTVQTIELITREDENLSRGSKMELVSKSLDIDVLREKFKDFMSGLQGIIEVDASTSSPFQLNEIQFSAEITVNGDFKLLGTGVGLETKGAVTFVLRRNP
jgi:hypothetical protein